MQIVLCIIYLLVGVLLAIPYCLLAGWSSENFPAVALVAPAFLFVWFMLASFAGVIDHDHRRAIRLNWRAAVFSKGDRQRLPGLLTIFWAWSFYSILPIILHWSAVLLGKIGYETVGSFVDMHRYASLQYIFVLTLMLLFIMSMREGTKGRLK